MSYTEVYGIPSAPPAPVPPQDPAAPQPPKEEPLSMLKRVRNAFARIFSSSNPNSPAKLQQQIQVLTSSNTAQQAELQQQSTALAWYSEQLRLRAGRVSA